MNYGFQLKRILRLLIWDESFRNRVFIVCFFGFPAVLGSAVSFLVNGGALFSFLQIITGFRRLKFDRDILLVSFFFYLYAFFSFVSSLANMSINSNLMGLVGILTFMLLPFPYSIISLTGKDQIRQACVAGCAFSSLAALPFAFFQFYFLNTRAEGGAGNAIVFGMMVGLAAAIVFATSFSAQGKQRYVLLLCGAAGTMAMILSGAKITWVAFFACLIIVLSINRKQVSFRMTRAKATTTFFAAALFGALAFAPVTHRIDNFFHELATVGTDKANSVSYRLAIWNIGIDAFLEKPLLGHGVGATKGIIMEGLTRKFANPLNYTHFHNGFLTALVKAGIFGAISIYGAFFAAAYIGVRSLRSATNEPEVFGATLLLLTVTTYLICGMTGILVGHDILDAVLMMSLYVGIYLASGKDAGLARQSAAHSGVS